jgi:hypothetical protein
MVLYTFVSNNLIVYTLPYRFRQQKQISFFNKLKTGGFIRPINVLRAKALTFQVTFVPSGIIALPVPLTTSDFLFKYNG